jgi:hypothetical protein
MTPRALLTVIGATAIAFAIAIGNTAGFAADGATTPNVIALNSAASSGTHLAHPLAMHSDQTASEANCNIAL